MPKKQKNSNWCYNSVSKVCEQTSGCNSNAKTKEECSKEQWCNSSNACSNNKETCNGTYYADKNSCNSTLKYCYDATSKSCTTPSSCTSSYNQAACNTAYFCYDPAKYICNNSATCGANNLYENAALCNAANPYFSYEGSPTIVTSTDGTTVTLTFSPNSTTGKFKLFPDITGTNAFSNIFSDTIGLIVVGGGGAGETLVTGAVNGGAGGGGGGIFKSSSFKIVYGSQYSIKVGVGSTGNGVPSISIFGEVVGSTTTEFVNSYSGGVGSSVSKGGSGGDVLINRSKVSAINEGGYGGVGGNGGIITSKSGLDGGKNKSTSTLENSIFTYGGGGGGGGYYTSNSEVGSGGIGTGGGGNGSTSGNAATNGVDGTGGGGGGGDKNNPTGGKGGSGVVIITLTKK